VRAALQRLTELTVRKRGLTEVIDQVNEEARREAGSLQPDELKS
jgi:hypothetical protein